MYITEGENISSLAEVSFLAGKHSGSTSNKYNKTCLEDVEIIRSGIALYMDVF
jgi:hypothetical protein